MAIGNSPSNPTNTTTNNSGAGASNGSQGDVFGLQAAGNTGTITTSDFGAISAASDIALSGLQSAQAAGQAEATTVQDALNKTQALGSQVSSGGITTLGVPLIIAGGLVLAIFFWRKK